jgi:hypothetical protein
VAQLPRRDLRSRRQFGAVFFSSSGRVFVLAVTKRSPATPPRESLWRPKSPPSAQNSRTKGAVTSRTNGAITCKTARKAFMRLSLLNRNRLSAGHFDEHSLLRLKKQKLSAKTHFLSQLDFAEILSNLVIPPSPQFQIRIGIPFKPKLLSLKRVVT